ncbi:dihydropteridine reductase-like [Sitophilus oryzae]|uniref:Dihydropteridine reductase n=1 Tax=Sitophilus oryzae TaxID=7048 RepID=A0A6J2YIE9_SITOR|nr:dihydropteridine reductase-like [Sitophilus oryzae]XP_030763177.1 dihydropteridine reductase-like [Sitophilus oryzae]
MVAGRVLVYGGKGALGSKCIEEFKKVNFWVASIDLAGNESADVNVAVNLQQNFVEQESAIVKAVGDALKEEKLDGIFCVAGGWAGGNASKDLAKNSEMMWKQSVCSSVIAASLASKYLKEGGVLQLTGANAALQGTPGMIGYGLAKAAVHHLTRSLSKKDSGLPGDSNVVAILPITLDTPMNRKWMPDADFSTWTPLEFIAELFVKWIKKQDRLTSGSLVQLTTKDSKTALTVANSDKKDGDYCYL